MLFILLPFLLKLVSGQESSEYIELCGFPENVRRCELTDYECIDKIDLPGHFFNTDEARAYILPEIDPMTIDTFIYYIRQYKFTFSDVEITNRTGRRTKHYQHTNKTDAIFDADYIQSGTFFAKTVHVVDLAENETILEAQNVNVSFRDVKSRAVVTITPRKRCDENIYFDFETDIHYVQCNETEIVVNTEHNSLEDYVTIEEIYEAFTAELSEIVPEIEYEGIKIFHATVPADKFWKFPDDIKLDVPITEDEL